MSAVSEAFRRNVAITGVVLGTWILMAVPAHAVTITGVMAPDLTRPSDGNLYQFVATVSGTYSAVEALLGDPFSIRAEYWDQDRFIFDFLDPDDPIDLTPKLNVPAPPGNAVAGTPWGPVSVIFRVGCTTGSKVFGPSGPTGENPMDDGYFYFPDARNTSWGYNIVECTGTTPTAGNARDMGKLADVPLPEIPEPSSMLLLGGGLLGLAGWRRRR